MKIRLRRIITEVFNTDDWIAEEEMKDKLTAKDFFDVIMGTSLGDPFTLPEAKVETFYEEIVPSADKNSL